MEMSTRKAPISRQAQDAPNEKLFKSGISHRHYTTRRRRIKVTFTDKFWDMVWPALAILDAVLLYTLIQIARGVL